ncbi:MAG TPA: DUF1963 domain-containing protein [Bacillota bacterium]
MKIRMEKRDEKPAKFWEIEVRGKMVTVRFGRSDGGVQTQTEDEFSSQEAANHEAEQQIDEKFKQGYKVAADDERVEDTSAQTTAQAEAIIAKIKAALNEDSLPYIGLEIETFHDEKPEPWQSNIGIQAYWPLEMETLKDSNGRELSFFGQMNLEELPKLPGYPEKGILLFFLSREHSDFEEEARVLYFDTVCHDASRLKSQSGLSFVTEGAYRITAAPEIQASHPYPPDRRFDQIIEQHGTKDKKVMELVEEEIAEWEHENEGHRMGGYCFFTQEDPRGRDEYSDYVNLFQIDELDDEIMLWGDSGIAHFLIHPDDLAKGDFSKVLFVWDCY